MLGRRIGITVAIICIALCASTAMGSTAKNSRDQADARRPADFQRIAQNRNQKIREDKSKPRKLELSVSRSQPIYIRLIEAEDVEYLGKHWTSQSQKEQMKETTLKRIRKKVQDDLLYEGFVSYLYEETEPKNSGKSEEPILLEILLEKLRYGEQQHLASISVKIHKLNDPTLIYGTFTDAGRVNRLSRRIAQRFTLSTDREK